MRTTNKGKTLAVAAVASLSLFAAACGSDDADTTDDTATSDPTEDTSAADDPFANLVGPGCEAYAEANSEGPASVEGMAVEPVATAAAGNPLLTTLVSAVSGELNPEVDLVDTLNGGEFTVFAPVDDAFAELDDATVDLLGTPEGTETLTSVLTYHVVPGQILPDDIAGTLETVNGADLEVSGSGDDISVGGGQANVICGGVATANATVYLIDAVLMPPAA